MTSIDEARQWRETDTVETPYDLMNAAKWGNANLARFVSEDNDRALAALRVIDMSKPKADVAKTATLELIAQRIFTALRELRPDDLPVHRPVLASGAITILAARLSNYAQHVLDAYNPRDYWSPERHVILEGLLFAEVIQPLISGGTLKSGRISVGLGKHPETGVHHSLVVGRVTLESA